MVAIVADGDIIGHFVRLFFFFFFHFSYFRQNEQIPFFAGAALKELGFSSLYICVIWTTFANQRSEKKKSQYIKNKKQEKWIERLQSEKWKEKKAKKNNNPLFGLNGAQQ